MTTLPTSPSPDHGGDRFDPAEGDRTLVRDALVGDEAALHRLAIAITPTVQARVARVLARRRGMYQGDPRARLEDLVQDTFVELLRDGGRVLRAWEPARGLSLAAFAGLVAEQRVLAFVRTRKASARMEEPTEEEALARRADGSAWDPETRTATREQLVKVLDVARAELTPLGRTLFDRLLMNEEDIASVASAMGMSISAVQAWSSRLKRRLAALAEEVLAEDASGRGKERARS